MTENANTGVQDDKNSAAGSNVDDQGKQAGANVDDKSAGAAEEQTASVPLSVFTKLRDELKQIKEQNNLYQVQLGMMRNVPGQVQPQPQPPQAQPSMEEDVFADMDDDDVMTVADAKKIMDTVKGGGSGALNQIKTDLVKLQLFQQDPDYENTIRSFLPEVINSNPAVADMIRKSDNPLQSALTFAKMNPRYLELNKKPGGQGETLLDQINRIIENSEKPGSASQAGGTGNISPASKFKDMTPAQIEEHKQKVIAGVI